jgi:1-acyl-sn-glycerol-3-phosphate acyltransferase
VKNLLRVAFFLLIVRPVISIFLGAHVRGRERLPKAGPAIIVANHNSHLDTLTIMAMFSPRDLGRVRPVAAADYFLRSRVKSWFAMNLIGIIPIPRKGRDRRARPLEACEKALDRGEILILFPEGSRGEPERLSEFKRGVAHLVRACPQTPVHPLFMYGLGKALPKDAVIFVPFNCEIVIGEKIYWNGSVDAFMDLLQSRMAELATQIQMTPWE